VPVPKAPAIIRTTIDTRSDFLTTYPTRSKDDTAGDGDKNRGVGCIERVIKVEGERKIDMPELLNRITGSAVEAQTYRTPTHNHSSISTTRIRSS
jgi:hypothetical protein